MDNRILDGGRPLPGPPPKNLPQNSARPFAVLTFAARDSGHISNEAQLAGRGLPAVPRIRRPRLEALINEVARCRTKS